MDGRGRIWGCLCELWDTSRPQINPQSPLVSVNISVQTRVCFAVPLCGGWHRAWGSPQHFILIFRMFP